MEAKMRNGKKIVHLILAFFMLILSLGTTTGCVFDPTVNVKRDGFNAYIYNGERYVRTSDMDNYNPSCGYGNTSFATLIGYAYNEIGVKIPVYIDNWDTERNVIIFCGYFNNLFYVKETVQLPPPLDLECVLADNFETTFQLKDFVSAKKDFNLLQKTKTLELIGYATFHFLPGRPLNMNFTVYTDKEEVYIHDDRNNLGCYQIIDKEFKQRLIKYCAD